MGFTNFHIHTEYSFRSSLLKVEEVARFASVNGFEGCAVTDLISTFGFMELSYWCSRFGLKPVFGCELFVRGVNGKGYYPVILIALNRKGLLNIYSLNSAAGRTLSEGRLRPLPAAFLFDHNEGLAILAQSEIYSHRHEGEILKKIIERYLEVFGENFYLEVNYTGEKSTGVLRELAELSEAYSLKPLAVCEARHTLPDKKAFDQINACGTLHYLKCGENSIPDEELDYSLKGRAEISEYFRNYPQYIENAEKLFENISNDLIGRNFPMPVYANSAGRLKKICEKRLLEYSGDESYKKRLTLELTSINGDGLSDFFLFSYELACFLKAKGISYGYGKGSNPSSLVLFLTGITKIDPVKYDLCFEFYKTPGVSFLTSLELEVALKKAGIIYNFISTKFGPDNTAYLSIIERWTARSALRMLSRKLPESNEHSAVAGRLAGIARKFQANPFCFAVIPGNIANFAPLYERNDGTRFTGLTREDAGYCNFLHVNLNASRFLSILGDGMRLAGIREIGFEDSDTFSLIREGNTNGIYILENYGIREFLREGSVDSISGLCDIIAIYRRGPISEGIAGNYLTRRRNNLKYGRISPLAHQTNPITWQTFGLILYEEQVIKIAAEAAGMEWRNAVELKKAIIDKNNPMILSFKDEFIKGCVNKGSDEESAYRLYGILLDTGKLAVKRTQTLSYAYLAYALAYLKKHYPEEFLIASLNNNISSPEIANRIILDIKSGTDMKILPVNINRSARLFSRDSGILRAGLEIVRHLGRGTAREIVRERVKNGNFKGMLDFALRMASSGLHEKALENLVKAGAFSESGYSVKELVAAVPAVYRYVLKEGQGQTDSLFGNEDVTPELGHFIKNSKHEDIDISNAEMEATELFISGHPLDRVASELGRFVVDTLDRITELLYGAFIVYLFQLKVSFKYPGACLATATVCDKKGMTRAVFIPSVYKKYSSIIRNHSIYLIRGNVKSGQLFVEQIFLFDEIAAV